MLTDLTIHPAASRRLSICFLFPFSVLNQKVTLDSTADDLNSGIITTLIRANVVLMFRIDFLNQILRFKLDSSFDLVNFGVKVVNLVNRRWV